MALAQVKEINSKPTEKAISEAKKLFGMKQSYNPWFLLSCDLFRYVHVVIKIKYFITLI